MGKGYKDDYERVADLYNRAIDKLAKQKKEIRALQIEVTSGTKSLEDCNENFTKLMKVKCDLDNDVENLKEKMQEKENKISELENSLKNMTYHYDELGKKYSDTISKLDGIEMIIEVINTLKKE